MVIVFMGLLWLVLVILVIFGLTVIFMLVLRLLGLGRLIMGVVWLWLWNWVWLFALAGFVGVIVGNGKGRASWFWIVTHAVDHQNFEKQGGIWGDYTTCASMSVSYIWWARHSSRLTDPHLGDRPIPAFNHLVRSNIKLKRLISAIGRIKDTSIR